MLYEEWNDGNGYSTIRVSVYHVKAGRKQYRHRMEPGVSRSIGDYGVGVPLCGGVMMKPPVIYLFDTQMQLIGAIRRYISLKFCRAWKSVGDKFEVNIADYNDILPLLKKGHYICLDGDSRRCGCIRGVRFVETSVRTVVITGFHANGLQGRGSISSRILKSWLR